MTALIDRDEREHSVDLAADRLAFLVVCYGALVLTAYRSFALGQEAWDVLGLVVLGGVVGLAYRLQKRVLTRPWTTILIATILVAAAVAALGVSLAGWR
jgi:hypothetical protein